MPSTPAQLRYHQRRREALATALHRPEAPDSGGCADQVAALSSRIAALEAQLAALSVRTVEAEAQVEALTVRTVAAENEAVALRAYRDNERARSRRNHQRRREARVPAPSPAALPVVTGSAASVTGTPPLARDVQSSPPPEYENYPGVSLTATAKPGGSGGSAAAVNAPPVVDVWSDARVLEAAARRPGIDLVLLQHKADDWLDRRRRDNPGLRLSVSTALGFIDRWRPGLETPLAASSGSGGGRRWGAPTLDELAADPKLDWISEAQEACRLEQDRILAAAGFAG